jgi:hypothetical protein
MPISKITGDSIDTAGSGITPAGLSTGAPSWTTTGNVGVGTNSAVYKLDVRDGTGSFTGNSGIGAIRVAGAGGSWFWIDNPTTTTMRLSSGATPGTGQIVIDNGGNLQVATTTGSEKITVGSAGNIRFQASSKVRIEYLNSGGAYILGTTGGAAVVFDTVSGVHQEIAFETHNSGNYHREHMRIDKDGKVTQPYQPAFYANGPGSNQTLGNQGNLVMSNAIYNIGGHYNTTNYRFTAPVAGRYLFTWSVFNNSATGRCAIKVNGGGYNDLQMDAGAGLSQSAIISLNANDYVTVGDWQNISGLQYWGSHSHFSGILLG